MAARISPETAARWEVIETARAMSSRGLSPGRSGNTSRRWVCRGRLSRGCFSQGCFSQGWGDGMLITPTGMAYDEIAPADVVFVDAGGNAHGRRKPSSEWRFHLAAYAARPDIGAVVHAHSLHAVVIACTGKPIPAFHYMVAVAGGDDIPCVPYATFGTEALANHVAAGLATRDACLMAHHGQIAVGRSLASALELAAEVEVLAEQYYKVSTLGRPVILSSAEMAEVIERFKGYGQNA